MVHRMHMMIFHNFVFLLPCKMHPRNCDNWNVLAFSLTNLFGGLKLKKCKKKLQISVKIWLKGWRKYIVYYNWAKITFQTDPHMTPATELDLSLWAKNFWLKIIKGFESNDGILLKWQEHNAKNISIRVSSVKRKFVSILLLIKLLSLEVVSAE